MNCSNLASALATNGYDVVDALARVDFNMKPSVSHMFGQIFADSILVRGANMRTEMNKIYKVSQQTNAQYEMPFANGLFHGAVWYITGTVLGISWRQIQSELCHTIGNAQRFFWSCLHGVGHGALIRQVATNYGRCSAIATPARTTVSWEAMAAAELMCNRAPSSQVANLCGQGLFHGFFEHLGVAWRRIHHPRKR